MRSLSFAQYYCTQVFHHYHSYCELLRVVVPGSFSALTTSLRIYTYNLNVELRYRIFPQHRCTDPTVWMPISPHTIIVHKPNGMGVNLHTHTIIVHLPNSVRVNLHTHTITPSSCTPHSHTSLRQQYIEIHGVLGVTCEFHQSHVSW